MSGAMADWMDERLVLVLFMGLNLLAVLAILLPGRRSVSEIYNRDVDGAALAVE
jgi:hypothetical protein